LEKKGVKKRQKKGEQTSAVLSGDSQQQGGRSQKERPSPPKKEKDLGKLRQRTPAKEKRVHHQQKDADQHEKRPGKKHANVTTFGKGNYRTTEGGGGETVKKKKKKKPLEKFQRKGD